MLFAHIVDDYYLQGVLAKMKDKSWWSKNCPGEMYKNDYIIGLLMHSISWATMILLPIFFATGFNPSAWVYLIWVGNIVIHCFVDDMKANKYWINLIQDQAIHVLQIFITWILWVAVI